MNAQLPFRPGFDPIKHVVYIMFENRSFLQILGDLTKIYPGLAGVDPKNQKFNEDCDGRRYYQRPTTERQLSFDPEHSMPDTAVQMGFGRMDGFVRDYQLIHPEATPAQLQAITDYYPLDYLPADHSFARHFTFFDHWHASVPGPTWPNRFFSIMGTSYGMVNMPPGSPKLHDVRAWFEQDQITLFDRLNEAGISWRGYFHDVPFSMLVEHQRRPHNAARYFGIEQFYADAQGPESEFPQFAYIEPRYQGLNESDDHPPHDVMKAQKLKADIYNAIFANEQLRNSTLFIITYDEHGGFFDDVYPAEAVAPDRHNQEYAFNQLGLRVPTYLISPWVNRGFDSGTFDHTSVLKYLQEKFKLGDLGQRTAHAASFAHLIGQMGQPRTDFPLRIELTASQLQPPDPMSDAATECRMNHLTLSMTGLTAYLEAELSHGYVVFARLAVRLERWFRRAFGKPPVGGEDEGFAEYRVLTNLVRRYVDQARKKSQQQ